MVPCVLMARSENVLFDPALWEFSVICGLDFPAWMPQLGGRRLAAAASQVGRVCYSVGWVAGGGTVLERELIRRVW